MYETFTTMLIVVIIMQITLSPVLLLSWVVLWMIKRHPHNRVSRFLRGKEVEVR
jgi:hypothetical protein